LGSRSDRQGEPKPESIADGLAEMTHPTVVVIDANHKVRFIDGAPNWMARIEAEPVPVIEAVRAVLGVRRDLP
jgi:hypothetical protein